MTIENTAPPETPASEETDPIPEQAPEQASEQVIEQVIEQAPEHAIEQAPEQAIEQAPLETLFPESPEPVVDRSDAQIRAILEAIIYITDEPLTLDQMTTALREPLPRVKALLDELTAEFARPEHGLTIQEVAGGYKMATKAEHHESVRTFVKNLKPPLKLSLPALETLSVIAYKQPITAPEIMDVRGVQGAGVLKTLLDRKLIATAGRKNVIGKPILYKTTREFLVQFGLKDLNELPSLKEFEEIGRMAITDEAADSGIPEPESPVEPAAPGSQPQPETEPQPETDA